MVVNRSTVIEICKWYKLHTIINTQGNGCESFDRYRDLQMIQITHYN